MGAVASCCCGATTRSNEEERPLLDSEREAVANLLDFLEHRDEVSFYEGEPLQALATLAYSENVDLQRSAALAFAEITEKDVRRVDRNTLEPVLHLLSCTDVEVQRASSAALGNLAVDTDNKALIVSLNGVEPLIRQMLSPNVEIQCNSVGCITNLATHDDNKHLIAKSGALGPLIKLARSKDMRVSRNSCGAALNMTHSVENRRHLINAGALPTLVSLLTSSDSDVQYYCTTAVSNIAVDSDHRRKLARTEPKLVQNLINLMESPSLKVQCQAALALRNLASDENFQVAIVELGGLPHLLRLLKSSFMPLILSSAACVRNVSIYPANEDPIISQGFLGPLIGLLSSDDHEVQGHAISTLRNLAASNESNKMAIVEAGVIERINELVLDASVQVQSEMTACCAVLGLSEQVKKHLLDAGICGVLVVLTASESTEVAGNAAAALGNLSSNAENYEPFAAVWNKPTGGLHGFFARFLASNDTTYQHLAVWTLQALLESGHPALDASIRAAGDLASLIDALADGPASNGKPRADEEGDGSEGEGDAEVATLARNVKAVLAQGPPSYRTTQ